MLNKIQSDPAKDSLIIEKISNEYEWLKYKEINLMHSIDDDMFQMKSIIISCGSNKQPSEWLDDESNKEFLEEFRNEFACNENETNDYQNPVKTYETRNELPTDLKGIYVHRSLVGIIAMWACPKRAPGVLKLLEELSNSEKQALEPLAGTKTKIDDIKSRLVPKDKDQSYVYLIWKEDSIEGGMATLHLVRCNKKTAGPIIREHIHQIWYKKENLPVVMTVNEEIKDIIRNNFPENDYHIKYCVVKIQERHLETLHSLIDDYFDSFQDIE